jgi:hypothetical protein
MMSNDPGLAGFSAWQHWCDEAARSAPAANGVYLFRLAEVRRGRIKGESDLVYIGCAENLSTRLEQHRYVRPDKENKGHQLERVTKEVGGLQVSHRSFDTPEKSQFCEWVLLYQHAIDHIELPPLNDQKPGKDYKAAFEALQKLYPSLRPVDLWQIRQRLGVG